MSAGLAFSFAWTITGNSTGLGVGFDTNKQCCNSFVVKFTTTAVHLPPSLVLSEEIPSGNTLIPTYHTNSLALQVVKLYIKACDLCRKKANKCSRLPLATHPGKSCNETDPDYPKTRMVPGQESWPSSGLAEKHHSSWSVTPWKPLPIDQH